jgi:hypothetical protein
MIFAFSLMVFPCVDFGLKRSGFVYVKAGYMSRRSGTEWQDQT